MLILCLSAYMVIPVKAAKKDSIVIELDPGHGGKDSGAVAEWFGDTVYEKHLNLTIATYLKEELEQYEGVTVKMTRTDDSTVSLPDRTAKAKKDQADVLISLHNNASGAISDYDHGSTILVASGNTEQALAQEGKKLGSQIVEELSKIGLKNQGLMERLSETNTRYANGNLADYYHIVKEAIKGKYMGIIVEHAFVDHGVDYKQYLRSDASLKRLALADANGIARYYSLHKKGEGAMTPIVNAKEIVTLVGGPQGRTTRYETFYEQKTEDGAIGENTGRKGVFSSFWDLIKKFLP